MSASTLLTGSPASLLTPDHSLDGVITINGPAGSGMAISTGQAVGSAQGLNLRSQVGLGADTSLYINSTPAAGLETEWRWCAGGTTAGGVNAGHLQLFKYVNYAFDQNVLDIVDNGQVLFPDPQGVGINGSFVVNGQSSFTNVLVAGKQGLAAGQTACTFQANPLITAQSVVVVTPMDNDATAQTFYVTLTPGVGFQIFSHAPATAGMTVSYFVVRL